MPTTPQLRPLLLLTLPFLAAGLALADEAPEAPGASGGRSRLDDAAIDRMLKLHHTEQEKVRLVLLPTSVTDKRGRIVKGLDRKDFKLFEDQIPQNIKFFSTAQAEPISVAFLLDVSGSMRQLDKLHHAKEAVSYFVNRFRADDRYGLICFADDEVAWITEFTDDNRRFLQRLQVQRGYGQTALNDAIAAAPHLVDESIKGRKAIVLITDGIDTASSIGIDRAVEIARQVNLPIFTIGFLSVSQQNLPKATQTTNLEVLRRVAHETGGRLFVVSGPDDLKEAIAYLDAELRFQYLLGYYPKSQADGRFHRIRVEVGRGSRMTVRTRTGFYSTP